MPSNNDDVDNYDKYQGKEKSGHAAATKGTSAASVAKLLKGIDFPANKNDLVKQAQQNKGTVENTDAVIDTIHQLPDKEYNSMADVEHEVGQVK